MSHRNQSRSAHFFLLSSLLLLSTSLAFASGSKENQGHRPASQSSCATLLSKANELAPGRRAAIDEAIVSCAKELNGEDKAIASFLISHCGDFGAKGNGVETRNAIADCRLKAMEYSLSLVSARPIEQ